MNKKKPILLFGIRIELAVFNRGANRSTTLLRNAGSFVGGVQMSCSDGRAGMRLFAVVYILLDERRLHKETFVACVEA